jgi:hypothetical protein
MVKNYHGVRLRVLRYWELRSLEVVVKKKWSKWVSS